MKNIEATMKELKEMTELLEETKAIVEGLQDEIKTYMVENDLDEILTEDGTKATFRDVVSNRFDSTNFKKQFADLYVAFTKKTSYKRFTFA